MEIRTVEGLRVRLTEMREEAQAALERAGQAHQRHSATQTRVGVIEARCNQVQMIRAHVATVTTLTDPCKAATTTADTRRGAADAKVKAIDKAIAMVDQHIAMADEGAAGPIYA